jgi:alkylated DNA repair dioxygenase AlkB
VILYRHVLYRISGVNSLFENSLPYPAGFNYYPDFLTVQEEAMLVSQIQNVSLKTFLFQGYEAKRKVASFGYDYHFSDRTLNTGDPIPSNFQSLIMKVENRLTLAEGSFRELLVTEYPIGSVINWHRDAPPFELIAGISLSSDCIFRFRPHDKAKQTKRSIISIPVQRRSLYVIDGQSRTDWQHSIMPVRKVRYSITLRTLRENYSRSQSHYRPSA